MHELDTTRWIRTLKVLEKCSSDPVQMTKMTAALIFRCRWVCHVHDQGRPRIRRRTTSLKGNEVAESTATAGITEPPVVHEAANERVSSDDGELTASCGSSDDSGDESSNDFATADNEGGVTAAPEDEEVDGKLGNDDGGEDNVPTICEEAEQEVEDSRGRGLDSPCEGAGEM